MFEVKKRKKNQWSFSFDGLTLKCKVTDCNMPLKDEMGYKACTFAYDGRNIRL